MSAAAVAESKLNRSLRFYQTTIGKKIIVAVTGIILFGFVAGHMLGNLQVFMGQEAMNAYGALLHAEPAILWVVRLVLLAAVGLHILMSVQLALASREARPVGYQKWTSVKSSYASRTMIWSGPIIGAFLVYHLLQFTVGVTGLDKFRTTELHGHTIPLPYDNVVAGFQNPIVCVAYIIAMALLMFHLQHGIWSMFQTLGVNRPGLLPKLKAFAVAFSLLLFLGFSSIPVAVLLGIVR
ncbi:MAG: succinate dehydrogenase cytochrome b subunit [Bryobacteraceae bacterium]